MTRKTCNCCHGAECPEHDAQLARASLPVGLPVDAFAAFVAIASVTGTIRWFSGWLVFEALVGVVSVALVNALGLSPWYVVLSLVLSFTLAALAAARRYLFLRHVGYTITEQFGVARFQMAQGVVDTGLSKYGG